jgi:type IV fimbrial biogenesis protein FimT
MKRIFFNHQTLSTKGLNPRIWQLRIKASMNNARLSAGFTLVELMVTLSLLAIILGFAVPGMQSLITSYRVSTLVNEFSSGLSHTRGEAVNRNMCVSMCISGNTTAANPTCSTTLNDWRFGWIIFADPDCNGGGNGARDVLLQVYEGKADGPQMVSNGNSRRLTFISRGTLSSVNQADTFNVNTGGTAMTPTRTLCLDIAGRVRVGDYNLLTCS